MMIKYLIILFFSISCVQRSFTGYIFDKDADKQIIVNKTTKEELLQIMGNPTFLQPFHDHQQAYYYAGGTDVRFLFLTRRLVTKKILRTIIDSNDKVVSVKFV